MRAVWICGLLALALFAATAWLLAPLEPGVLALQFAWTPRRFGEIIHVWPSACLARYRWHLPVDCALLLAYGAFGWLLATRTRLFAPLPAPARAFAQYCLPLAALFDAAENAFHWWLTGMPRFGVPDVYLASAGCSAAKWVLLIGFGALALWAVARSGE
ncbi:hypothetical protein [Thauera sinica]|uniref:Transmembrane protein n=1 Tax=Thauera sinica TaxID=2665146 RepID=A0ABW1AMI1_9RHOO|nr:hypothetical protein [Thauera sp. K11]ATE59221.1 hypothetical protein CCZ27_03940 [Thauera sp. K11]